MSNTQIQTVLDAVEQAILAEAPVREIKCPSCKRTSQRDYEADFISKFGCCLPCDMAYENYSSPKISVPYQY